MDGSQKEGGNFFNLLQKEGGTQKPRNGVPPGKKKDGGGGGSNPVGNYESVPLDCDSEKVLHIFKCKACCEIPNVQKAKTKLYNWFNNL